MRAYLDSSALIKRAVLEPESGALLGRLESLDRAGYTFQTSVLGTIEVSRGVRARLDIDVGPAEVADAIEVALSGVAQIEISEPVSSIARRLFPASLRSLDAIHLATAFLVDADLVIAYDRRLLTAAEELGFRVESPGF